MIIYWFLKYAEEWHSRRNYLGPRWWSPYALWEFREYNEVDHLFERRTVASIKHADEYLKQFPSPVPTVVAGGVSFISGAFVGILMLFTLIDESILLHIKLDGRNLVWYIAVLSGVLAITRSFASPVEQVAFTPNKVMRRVVAYTHYLPDRWRAVTHTFDVRDEFNAYFPYKVVLLLRELGCILTTPYVMMKVLPGHVDTIVDFIQARTVSVPGVGDVCAYSRLDLAAEGDPLYGAKRTVPSTLGDSLVTVKRNTVKDGKLEKSWLNFRVNYPSWVDNQRVDHTLDEFQRRMVEDLSRHNDPKAQQDAHFVPKNSESESLNVSVEEMSASYLAAAQLDRRHALNQATSTRSVAFSHANHDYFASDDAAVRPLGASKYPNAENYFFWLEEYRDTQEKLERDRERRHGASA